MCSVVLALQVTFYLCYIFLFLLLQCVHGSILGHVLPVYTNHIQGLLIKGALTYV